MICSSFSNEISRFLIASLAHNMIDMRLFSILSHHNFIWFLPLLLSSNRSWPSIVNCFIGHRGFLNKHPLLHAYFLCYTFASLEYGSHKRRHHINTFAALSRLFIKAFSLINFHHFWSIPNHSPCWPVFCSFSQYYWGDVATLFSPIGSTCHAG